MPAAASRRPKVKTAVSFDRALECLFSRLVSRANRRREKEVPCDARDQVTSPKRHETERERARSAIATPATRSSEPASPATTSERALVQQHVERACDGLALGDAVKQRARPFVERRRRPRSDGGGNGAPLEPPRPRERDREDAELGRAARPRGLEGCDWEGARRRACPAFRRRPRHRLRHQDPSCRRSHGRPDRRSRSSDQSLKKRPTCRCRALCHLQWLIRRMLERCAILEASEGERHYCQRARRSTFTTLPTGLRGSASMVSSRSGSL